MIIDLSLKNNELYRGCEVGEVGGRLTLLTEPEVATNIVGRNMLTMIEAIPSAQRDEVILTGPMAVWAYMVVFHQVVHRFKKIYYNDGRSSKMLIAQH